MGYGKYLPSLQGGPPTSYKYGYKSTYRGYNPSYPIIRPFIGVITPFITSRGPPCTNLSLIRPRPPNVVRFFGTSP